MLGVCLLRVCTLYTEFLSSKYIGVFHFQSLPCYSCYIRYGLTMGEPASQPMKALYAGREQSADAELPEDQ